MSIDIVRGIPQDLVGCTLSELWDAIRAIETWTPHHAVVLDFVYRHLVLQCVRLDDNLEDLYALYEHLIRAAGEVAHGLQTGHMPHSIDPLWSEQWRGYAAVIDARIALLRAAKEAPEYAPDASIVMTHLHVREFLKEIQNRPGIPQRILGERFDVDIQRVRRIVNIMVHVGLVVRRNIKSENALHPGRIPLRDLLDQPVPRRDSLLGAHHRTGPSKLSVQ